MAEFDRTCFRLACHLQQGIGRLQTSDVSQCMFRQQDLVPCQQLFRKLEKARRRHLNRAAAAVASDLDLSLRLLQERLGSYLAGLAVRSVATTVPSLKTLYYEVLGLSEEFDKIHYDLEERLIVVTTEPIELEDVCLGAFEIRLSLNRLGEHRPYEVEAIDPQSAAADEMITHPHVKDKQLCEGDGRAGIRRALAAGRLADFFQIVNQVLHSYNSGSAYAQLDEWFDIACTDCGDMTSADSAHVCGKCDKHLCEDCAWKCKSCFSSLCSECGQACPQCKCRFCDVCLHECAKCGDQFCPSCLSQGKCQGCHDQDPSKNEPSQNEPSQHDAGDGEAAATGQVPPASSKADLTIQSASLGQTPVLA